MSEADLVWDSLDAQLNEREKLYWVKVIEAAIRVDSSIKLKK